MTLTAPSTRNTQLEDDDWPKIILGRHITGRALRFEDGSIMELEEPPELTKAMNAYENWKQYLAARPESVHPERTVIVTNIRRAEKHFFEVRRTWLASEGLAWENGEIVKLHTARRRRR